MPTCQKRAQKLLKGGRAVVHLSFPFTIRLKDRDRRDPKVVLQELGLKIDPGSGVTGLALVRNGPPETSADPIPDPSAPAAAPAPVPAPPAGPSGSDAASPAPPGPAWNRSQCVVGLFELRHKGKAIHEAMMMRAMFRGRRRSANLWYREQRSDNRRRPEGWVPPSTGHVPDSVENFAKKLMRLAPVVWFGVEDCQFDTQAMENPEISGVEYQRGELVGREVREYVLEKFGRRCVYCGAERVPLELDHVVPLSKGGSNRVSNLVLTCRACNLAKGNRDLREFLADRPELAGKIEARLKTPLRAAATMNSVRKLLVAKLSALGLPVFTSSGAMTKNNRDRNGAPKFHAGDAACVGKMSRLLYWLRSILVVICVGRGKRQRQMTDKFGFPRGEPRPRHKRIHGFATGDFVAGTVTKGRNLGVHRGRVTVQSSGQFYIKGAEGKRISFSHKNARLIQRGDGHAYLVEPAPKNREEAEARMTRRPGGRKTA